MVEQLFVLPVEGIAHLNGDQHRQGHGHGSGSLKDLTFQASKVLVLIMALHEVGLHREEETLQGICDFKMTKKNKKFKIKEEYLRTSW